MNNNDIFYNVSQYLPVSDINELKRVSKRFNTSTVLIHDVVSERVAHRYHPLEIANYKGTNVDVNMLNLKHLTLTVNSDMTIPTFIHLKTLTISSTASDDITITVENQPKLTSISLKDDRNVSHIIIKGCDMLKMLTSRNMKRIWFNNMMSNVEEIKLYDGVLQTNIDYLISLRKLYIYSVYMRFPINLPTSVEHVNITSSVLNNFTYNHLLNNLVCISSSGVNKINAVNVVWDTSNFPTNFLPNTKTLYLSNIMLNEFPYSPSLITLVLKNVRCIFRKEKVGSLKRLQIDEQEPYSTFDIEELDHLESLRIYARINVILPSVMLNLKRLYVKATVSLTLPIMHNIEVIDLEGITNIEELGVYDKLHTLRLHITSIKKIATQPSLQSLIIDDRRLM